MTSSKRQGGRKPHIFYFKFKHIDGGYWVCKGDSHTGYGKNPAEAYWYWKDWYEDTL